MSWDQDYCVPSFLELLIKLTGKHPEEVLVDELHNQGIEVVNIERVELDSGFYGPVVGDKITLSDGRVFIPKLVEKFNQNGNYGRDTYQYCLESETPEIMYIGMDTAEEPSESDLREESY